MKYITNTKSHEDASHILSECRGTNDSIINRMHTVGDVMEAINTARILLKDSLDKEVI